jgi:hypothetical protein
MEERNLIIFSLMLDCVLVHTVLYNSVVITMEEKHLSVKFAVNLSLRKRHLLCMSLFIQEHCHFQVGVKLLECDSCPPNNII